MNAPPGQPWHSDIKSRLIHHPALNKELENVSAIYLCEGSGVRGLVGDLSVIFICGRAGGLIRTEDEWLRFACRRLHDTALPDRKFTDC